jgi:hypothetical protein
MEPTSHPQPRTLADVSPVEELKLSVRTRNALRGVGCSTIADVLRLDLDRPLRGLGKLAKEELLVKLERAGFPHPSDGQPASEITRLERSLERIEHRIDSALGALSKEVRAARHKLRRLRVRTSSDVFPPANGVG